MKTEATRRLGIEHPLIQGPFGGGISTVELVAAVSNHGCLGSYGAYMQEPDELVATVAAIRAATDKPFAINLWVSDHDPGGDRIDAAAFDKYRRVYEPLFDELGLDAPEQPEAFHPGFARQVEALIEARPPAFSFVFGIPAPAILAECRSRGIATIGAATTLAEAEALDEAGVDLIVATGFEAAGHRPSFLKRAEDSLMGTMALVRIVTARVRTPVIAAGGMIDGHGVAAALELKASAAQLGTAFLACAESGATPPHRAALFSEAARETMLTRSYSGRLARGMPNRLVREMEARAAELAPFPIHGWFVAKLKAASAAAGSGDLAALYASQAAPGLRHRRVSDLIPSLLERI